MSCGVGHRLSLDLVWLWCRLAATAPIRPLAWEPPHDAGAALKNKSQEKKRKKTKCHILIMFYRKCVSLGTFLAGWHHGCVTHMVTLFTDLLLLS